MSELEVRKTDSPQSFELYAEGVRVGHLTWADRDDDDPADFRPGWFAELHGSSMWGRTTDFDPDIKVIIETARSLNDEREEHERSMRRIDRNRPRTVSIPSGGQPT